MSWFYLSCPVVQPIGHFSEGLSPSLSVFSLRDPSALQGPGGWGEWGRWWGQNLWAIFFLQCGSFSCMLPIARSGDSNLASIDSCSCLERQLSSWTCTFKFLLRSRITYIQGSHRHSQSGSHRIALLFQAEAGSLQMSQDRWKWDSESASELQSCENLRFCGGVILFLERTSARMGRSLIFSGERFSFSFLQLRVTGQGGERKVIVIKVRLS